jgi:hypothetical protein
MLTISNSPLVRDWLSYVTDNLIGSPARGGFTSANMAVMEGPLSKWTNVVKGWQYRWFVLDDNAGLLSYYTVCISKYLQNVAKVHTSH